MLLENNKQCWSFKEIDEELLLIIDHLQTESLLNLDYQMKISKVSLQYELKLLDLNRERILLNEKIKLIKNGLTEEEAEILLKSEAFQRKIEKELREEELALEERQMKVDKYIFGENDQEGVTIEDKNFFAEALSIRKRLLQRYHPDVITFRNPDLTEAQITEISEKIKAFLSITPLKTKPTVDDVLVLKLEVERIIGYDPIIESLDGTVDKQKYEDQYKAIIIKKMAELKILKEENLNLQRLLLDGMFNFEEGLKRQIIIIENELEELKDEYNQLAA